MNREELETERVVNFFHWAQEEARKEVARDFALARLASDAPGSIIRLPPGDWSEQDRLICMSGRVKNRHKAAMVITNNVLSIEEEEAVARFRAYLRETGESVLRRRWDYDQSNYTEGNDRYPEADYGDVMRRCAAALEADFGPAVDLSYAPHRGFYTKIGRWSICTSFYRIDATRELTYMHDILLDDERVLLRRPGISNRDQTQAITSSLSWLGLGSSTTSWVVRFDKDVEPAIEALVASVVYFLEAAPTFLPGL